MDCAADAAPRGYGRVSTRDQNPGSQRDAFQAAMCDEIFTGKGASGKLASRPELDRALARLRPGDTLVITRLSHAMRSLRHLLELAAGLGTDIHDDAERLRHRGQQADHARRDTILRDTPL